MDRICKDAAAWVVKHDKGLSAQEQDSFFEWLAEDPRHGEMFADNKHSWGDFDLLAQWRPEHSEEPNPDLLATTKIGRACKFWSVLGGLAAAIALMAFVWMPRTEAPVEAVNSYVINYSSLDYGYHQLEDGSEIDLNKGTELKINYSNNARLVQLVSGEAHFIVKKDVMRPFIVEVGGATVRAVGTAFNVRLSEDSLEVLVTEGRVRMDDYYSVFKSALSKTEKAPSQDVSSGYRSFVSIKDGQANLEITSVRNEEIGDLLHWKPDILDFSSTPLSAAIDEFNKRNDVQIVIADHELANEPIVASFRSNNIDGFVRLLKLTLAVEADRQNEEEIILYNTIH